MKNKLLLLSGIAFLYLAAPASASIIGHLAVANCPGGGVTVTGNTIDWINPVDAGNGCIVTAATTNITGTTTLGPGVFGNILDLTSGGGAVPGFMTIGSVSFNLDANGFGPGVANTACANSFNGADPACSVIAGSPFILAPTAGGTSISLVAHGTATDASGDVSRWSGFFTTQISNATPFAVQQLFFTQGSISSSYSGAFDIVAIPEPVTLGLIGAGLIVLAWRRRSTEV